MVLLTQSDWALSSRKITQILCSCWPTFLLGAHTFMSNYVCKRSAHVQKCGFQDPACTVWMHLNGPPLGILRTLSRGRLAASQRSPSSAVEQGSSTMSVLTLDYYSRVRAGCLGSERVIILRLRRRPPPPPPRVPAALAAVRLGSVPRRGRNARPGAGAGLLDLMPGPSTEGLRLRAQDRGPVSLFAVEPPLHHRHRPGSSRHGPRRTRDGEVRRSD